MCAVTALVHFNAFYDWVHCGMKKIHECVVAKQKGKHVKLSKRYNAKQS